MTSPYRADEARMLCFFVGGIIMLQSTSEYEERNFDDIQRALDIEHTVKALESQLCYDQHSPEEVARQILKAACKFYDADWCGLIQVDLDLKIWTPFWWYNDSSEDKTTILTEDVFSLLDNLLKWTKSQIGKLNVVYQDFDIVGNIASVIEIFNLVAGMKNIKVNFPVYGKIEVHADMDMMKTILRNLLSNAIKFSYNDSEILVNAEIEGDKVIVSVKDTGKGMSEEDQKKLLNTETHFSKYGTNNEEGSGLGLLLCQDFAVKNGGHLWFESEEGKGSTFFFSVALKK